jgi:hypothetical protein
MSVILTFINKCSIFFIVSAGGKSMKCPYCLQYFIEDSKTYHLQKDVDGDWGIIADTCPACKKVILRLAQGLIQIRLGGLPVFVPTTEISMFRPKAPNRSPLSPQVPKEFAEDYQEACFVLVDSPKASAALSRRCLQNIIREKLGIIKRDLATEIQEVLDRNLFPTYISDILDAVRNIGNFAAHPTKSQSTGEIYQVEPGEAELNLDVIEALFDFCFIQPENIKKKTVALNAKLAAAGKPPIKQP